MENEQQYEKGKLYQWNGSEFIELAPSADTKIPVSEEAAEVVKTVRKSAHQCIGLRPELSLTTSAMLLAAAELPDIEERVRQYGQRIYGSPAPHASAMPSKTETPAMPEPQGDGQQEQQTGEKPAATYLG